MATRRFLLAAALVAGGAPLHAQAADPGYRVGVVSESGDIVTWLRPGDGTLAVDHVVPVGIMPSDIDGPHNVTVAPDGKSYYISIAHGTPYGSLWRLSLPGDTLIGRAPLELFPTTISVTPDGEIAFVANSDFYGDRPRVNPVSIIQTSTMSKIADVAACDMPHGVKVNHGGTHVYITCMISDEVLDEVFGLGPLEPLLTDPTISDILVNTYKQVYVERRGLLELTNVTQSRDI